MSSEWLETTLGEICKQQNGSIQTGPFGSQLHASDYVPVGVPVVMPANIGADGGISEDGIARISHADKERLAQHQLKMGDVVFSRRGDVTRNALVEPHQVGWLCGTGCLKVRLGNESIAFAKFISYCLRLPETKSWLIRHAVGATMPNLNTSILSAVPITLPPVDVQKEIADFLGALDDRITLLRETNTTLEAIAQALFKSWFVDFAPVHAKQQGRAPEGMDAATAALFPDSFEESELGMVPKGWRVGHIGGFVSVTDYVANGSFASLKENVTLYDSENYAIYLRTTDFNSGFSGGLRFVDKKSYDFLEKSSLNGSEVIISNVGDVGTVFRPPVWLGYPMTLGSNAIALKSNGLTSYLYLYFRSYKGQNDIKSIVTGSAQLKFNKTNFRSLSIALPVNSVLVRFEETVGTFLKKIDNNSALIKELATLRDALLPRLISGQLRLPEAQELAQAAVAE
ncbi:restriction endonuclease subunit S [Comamonas jiangduensis]|uniref:restriction endonuclease subunit S n=1 Tax=Comamonas jiangduensis TaxID=1194168 RepID=UPI003BF77B30